MNLGDLDLKTTYNKPQFERAPSKQSIAVLSEQLYSDEEYVSDSSTSSSTSKPTVVHWQPASPSSSSSTRSLESQRPHSDQSEATAITVPITFSNANEIAIIPTVQTDEPREKMSRDSRNYQAARMRELETIVAGTPSPDVDDTVYLRFAIDQITRDQDIRALQRPGSVISEASYPVERVVPDSGLGYLLPTDTPRPSQSNRPSISSRFEVYVPTETPIHQQRYPNLYFVPRTLRPFPMLLAIVTFLSMTAALMFCGIYSLFHNGLADYTGAYDGRYFLFGFLPQIVATILFLWVEGVIGAIARVLPYAMMASNSTKGRENAMFLGIHPMGIFWPRLDYFSAGAYTPGICSILLWPVYFTIPLQSCLFSVVQLDGVWRYTACQGVCWTLVAIYVLAALALIGTAFFFFWRTTGLIWDMRSLADIVSLLPRSNNVADFEDTEILGTKAELRKKLATRSDRLGYWKTTNPTQDIFYCIGEEGAPTRRYTMQQGKAEKQYENDYRHEKYESDVEALRPPHSRGTNSSLLAKIYSPAIRFRHIPWFLNDTSALLWPIAFFILYLALLIVSFLPRTALRNGFSPQLSATTNEAGFSPANFVYSLIPSLIGLFLHSFLNVLFYTLARLAPWAALSDDAGATPQKSILLDYTASASIPFATIPTALGNGNFLIASLAFLNPLTLILPILGGGIFSSFVAIPSNELLMFTDLPAYYVVLVVLGLYLCALLYIATTMISARQKYRLPHPVTTLAEIISFLYASEILHDAAFRAVRSKVDLRTRLVGARSRGGQEVRFWFGIFRGRDGRSHLGVERVGRGDTDEGRESGGALGTFVMGRSRSRFSA